MHDGLVTMIDIEGTVFGPLIFVDIAADDDVAVESSIGTEPVVLNLVADGAGHAVLRGALELRGFGCELLEGKAGKDMCVAAGVAVCKTDSGHVADRAVILDEGAGLGVVHSLAPDARLPVGISRGVGH